MKKGVIARKTSQLFFLLLFLFILWSTTYPLSGGIPAEAIFKLDPLLMAVASIAGRLVVAGGSAALAMLVLAAVSGRFFCGWVCPLGTMIDGISPRRRPVRSPSAPRLRVKFLILLVIAGFAVMGVQLAWIADPLVIAGRFVSLNLIPAVTLALDKAFEILIRAFRLYGPVYDFYRGLKQTLLGIEPRFFSHSLVIFASFAALLAYGRFSGRGWCRNCCPLGALYACVARFSVISRRVEGCAGCGACAARCPMDAIRQGGVQYEKGECILCLECVYACPGGRTSFGVARKPPASAEEAGGLTRRQFLSFMFAGLIGGAPGAPAVVTGRKKRRQPVLRPPGALAGEEFLDRCIRCGNCMKVCITNGLQPVLLQAGLGAFWTPQLFTETGYCEYNCTLCGSVCPTGAIPRLSVEEKKKTRIGLARIDRHICLPWKEKKECLVCEEHCPVARKAIRRKEVFEDGRVIRKPYVDPRLCIGCGICQARCPTRPKRAIAVLPVRVTHGKPLT